MSHCYIINVDDRNAIYAGTNIEPSLPEDATHLRVRRFDKRLTPDELQTEINRVCFQRKESLYAAASVQVDEMQTAAKLALLAALWAEYRRLDKGKSIRAFALHVLKCHHEIASRVINQDTALEPEDVLTYYEIAKTWQTANPSGTSPLP